MVTLMMNIGNANGNVIRFFLDVTALMLPRLRPAILVLGSLRPVNIIGILELVLLLLLLCQLFPVLSLVRTETLPLLTDGL